MDYNDKITTSGKAESMLHASHIARSQHAHQVTAASLYILQQHAYSSSVNRQKTAHGPTDDYNRWCELQSGNHQQFNYWKTVLQLELTVLLFVRSVRQADFDLYVQSLSELVPWFFALNHQHCVRWASVHLRDMITTDSLHPAIAKEFTVNKRRSKPFSAIGLDHAHKQLDAPMKGVGGAVGLTENADALHRWMVAGPEVARVVTEFEQASGCHEDYNVLRHHEQTPAQQIAFIKQISSLVSTIENMGNPFLDGGNELYALDTHNVCDISVVKTVETVGCEQFNTFVQDRLIACTTAINSTLPRNKLPLFKTVASKPRKRAVSKLQLLRNDCSIYSKLYIACQTTSGDLDMFFEHENQPSLPSLSSDGNLDLVYKADLLVCLENVAPAQTECPVFDAVVVDCAAVVQMLHPGQTRTFKDYAEKIFLPHIVLFSESRMCRSGVGSVFFGEPEGSNTNKARCRCPSKSVPMC